MKLSSTWVTALIGVVLWMGTDAQAYTRTVTDSGTPVTWARDAFTSTSKINFEGNAANISGLSAESVRQSVIRALRRWQIASAGAFIWDYWQGSDPSVYSASSSYNGYSNIYFTSQASQADHSATNISPAIIGLTQVWHDASSGRILETDIQLNDNAFTFSLDPHATTGMGNGGPSAYSGGKPTVYIDNIMTHEMGHALGLSHSGTSQATMLPYEAPQQALIACDERAGIRAMYPMGNDNQVRGQIRGRIVGGMSGIAAGAHILAVSRKRATVMASVLSDSAGNFAIAGLEAGEYILVVERFAYSWQNLSNYYKYINSSACGSQSNWVKQVITNADGHSARVVSVGGGGVANVGDLAMNCSGSGVSSSMEGSLASNGVWVDSGTHTYTLSHAGGALRIKALSFSMGGGQSVNITVMGANGNFVRPVFAGNSGYQSWDSRWESDSLAAGSYQVSVVPQGVSSAYLPGGSTTQDTRVGFVLFTETGVAQAPALAGDLPDNARCEAADLPFNYISPATGPQKAQGSGGVGFCGSIKNVNDSHEVDPNELMGWMLSWAPILLVALARKLRLKKRAYFAQPASLNSQ